MQAMNYCSFFYIYFVFSISYDSSLDTNFLSDSTSC